jgi:adenine-specific DNA-methyltransferase
MPPRKPNRTEIETLRHPDDVTRANIPTAETSSLMGEEEAAPRVMLYPRNPDLDPQLVWRGKDAQDAEPLAVPTVPIYIQEKVLPEALIRDVVRQSRQGVAAQADLFGGFDRIADPEAKLEFYRHAENWSNRMILGDSLLVMNSLAEKEGLRGQVQMIYLDPPYGIRFASNWQPSTRSREVKEGKVEGLSREPEQIAAFRDTWKDGIHSYLAYLRDRLVVARDLLTESGSIFVQIGEDNIHLLRSLLDETFGRGNDIGTIVFAKSSGSTGEFVGRHFDYILWYARERNRAKYHPLFRLKEIGGSGASGYNRIRLADGTITALTEDNISTGQVLTLDNLTSQASGREKGEGAASWFPVELAGKTFRPTETSRWKTNEMGMGRLARADRLAAAGNTLRYVRYLDDFRCFPVGPLWTDTTIAGFSSAKRYVVETDPPVIERCVLMTTDAGDLVLDPTCGSGTTAVVAEQWGRRWITIDTSRVALALARTRLMAARHPAYLLRDSKEGTAKEAELTARPPDDGPFQHDVRQGFVLERVPHVTLKSIANNAEIDVIHEKWQPTLDAARGALNAALGTAYEEWQVPRTLPDHTSAAARKAHTAFWSVNRRGIRTPLPG